jgi:hypothetical protein
MPSKSIQKKRELRSQIGRNAMRRGMRSRKSKENANTSRQGLHESECSKCQRVARVPGSAKRHRGCGGRWR